MSESKPSQEVVMAKNIAAVRGDDSTRRRMLAKVPPEQRERVKELVSIADQLRGKYRV